MSVIGIGTDIVEIERIRQQLARSDRLARRVLSAQEFIEFEKHHAQAAFLAKRFAAKEAAAKALGTGISGGMRFEQIWVDHDELGKPLLVFEAESQVVAEKLGVTHSHLSISDERSCAMAMVVLESRCC